MDGTSNELEIATQLASFSAIDNSVACELCGQSPFVEFATALAKKLRDTKQKECFEMVIYGAAFGSDYERMVDDVSGSITQRLVQLHQQCFFTFVLGDSVAGGSQAIPFRTSRSGLQIKIPVPLNVFPYKDMRRNVKLFKMYAGLVIFSFSERVIWQDAKLWKKDWIQDSPIHSNYRKLFGENVEKQGVCVSFRALPNDPAAVGWVRKGGPRFQYHCETLETSDRPGVTDDREVVRKQCDYYRELPNDSYKMSLDSGMIDSAFILWDMRGARCLDFNTKLTCTWLGEIQCFGDRDQVSFAHALRSMGVYQPHPAECNYSMSIDKLFVGGGDPATPLVHIGRGNCHWYYSSHARNMFTCGSNPVAIATASAATPSAATTSTATGTTTTTAANQEHPQLVLTTGQRQPLALTAAANQEHPRRQQQRLQEHPLVLKDGKRASDFSVKTLNELIRTASRRLAIEHSVLKECVLAAGGVVLVALLTLALRTRASAPGFDNLPHQPPSDAPDTHEPLVASTME